MFYFDDFYGKKVLRSTLLKGYECFFTTKDFLLTPAKLDELKEETDRNKEFLKKHLMCQDIITAKQVHGDNVEIVSKDCNFYDNTDALVSNIENTLMIMNFADCVPIIMYSKESNTGAIVHAGWRGTAQHIAQKTVKKMVEKLNIKPKYITALIGPSIGKCCFETDEDVFRQLIEDKTQTNLYEKRGEKYFIDLKLLNQNQLEESGIINIDVCSYCTFCMSDIFCSYRKEKGKTARHSAVVKIKGERRCL